ncbi:hypothetical protein Tdes44962_MAKER08040 [Teratosphaeria destructans]|uniref:Uncharacterized protein n=1 Tax=Teratosphaeria destructans TaxID=418781 RepID=A0A9W7SXA9_9PEZI|nr:hypothetical protein Tdes44962_MAKER08040 [Teratosphaeria destructans]
MPNLANIAVARQRYMRQNSTEEYRILRANLQLHDEIFEKVVTAAKQAVKIATQASHSRHESAKAESVARQADATAARLARKARDAERERDRAARVLRHYERSLKGVARKRSVARAEQKGAEGAGDGEASPARLTWVGWFVKLFVGCCKAHNQVPNSARGFRLAGEM